MSQYPPQYPPNQPYYAQQPGYYPQQPGCYPQGQPQTIYVQEPRRTGGGGGKGGLCAALLAGLCCGWCLENCCDDCCGCCCDCKCYHYWKLATTLLNSARVNAARLINLYARQGFRLQCVFKHEN
ncbi:hypothetical protein RB195_015047 [Necator americanus]|uniref:Cysteine-rich transmembrane CYSTM domain-containing protein n=3 Tax=Necator americanus TaxID=51031 RepID=A0ABR1E2R7_NECAM